jgi:hypothetical protein
MPPFSIVRRRGLIPLNLLSSLFNHIYFKIYNLLNWNLGSMK